MSKKRKTEDANYFKGVQERLAKLDHEKCIKQAKELTAEARREGAFDMNMCACMVEKIFGIPKRDLYALTDIDALQFDDRDPCNEYIFTAIDIRQLFERAAKAKMDKKKSGDSSTTEMKSEEAA